MRSIRLPTACLAAAISSLPGCYDDTTCDNTATCPEDTRPDASDSGSGGSVARGGSTGAGGALPDASDGSAGVDASTSDARTEEAAPACDTDASPYTAPCAMKGGIFVSALGSNNNQGTQDSPVATINRAVALAKPNQRIYVCSLSPDAARAGADASDAGGPVDYTEPVKIESIPDGVHLWGGFDCTTWQPVARAARIRPQAGQIALTIANTNLLTLEDLEFEAADAQVDGGSSIAAFVRSSSRLTLRNVSLKAGKGRDGAAGAAAVSNYGTTYSEALAGKRAQGVQGGGQCVNTCVDQPSSTGGMGGSVADVDAGADAGGAQAGTDGSSDPDLGATSDPDGLGGTVGGSCNAHNGASAPSGADGRGARTRGTLTSSGWTPADGEAGENGRPGQGGGGGASVVRPSSRGGGGGGGCGGCGGGAGRGGQGGGSSVALLSLDATITLDSCTLVAAAAGAGGAGSQGEGGQSGGDYGAGDTPGCPGGMGGNGGNGGSGGGGAGGLSVGIAHKNSVITRVHTDPTVSDSVAAGGGASTANDAGATADASPSTTVGTNGVSSAEWPIESTD